VLEAEKGVEKVVTAKVEAQAQEAKAQLAEVKNDLGAAADSASREAGAGVDAARDTVDLVRPVLITGLLPTLCAEAFGLLAAHSRSESSA
jgi:hypothetical protein